MEVINNTPGQADSLRVGADKINANFAETVNDFTATNASIAALEAKVDTGNFASDLVLDKASGHGLKVDSLAPTFGWRDLIGQIVPAERYRTDFPRNDTPLPYPFRGTYAKAYSFKTNDVIDQIVYHIPHDYVPGTDIFLHVHWGHNGTAISGSFVLDYYVIYAKGHDQAIFNVEIDITQTILTPDIATVPQWQHRLDEFRLSNQGGDSTHLDTLQLEVDGLIILGLKATTVPTISGSASSNLPFIFTVDVHYQSTGMATKEKAPNFYI